MREWAHDRRAGRLGRRHERWRRFLGGGAPGLPPRPRARGLDDALVGLRVGRTRPLLRAGIYWPGGGVAGLEQLRAEWRESAPVAAIVFYRHSQTARQRLEDRFADVMRVAAVVQYNMKVAKCVRRKGLPKVFHQFAIEIADPWGREICLEYEIITAA